LFVSIRTDGSERNSAVLGRIVVEEANAQIASPCTAPTTPKAPIRAPGTPDLWVAVKCMDCDMFRLS